MPRTSPRRRHNVEQAADAITVGTMFVKIFNTPGSRKTNYKGVVTAMTRGPSGEDICAVSFDHGIEDVLTKDEVQLWSTRNLKPYQTRKVPYDWMAITTFIWVIMCVVLLVYVFKSRLLQ